MPPTPNRSDSSRSNRPAASGRGVLGRRALVAALGSTLATSVAGCVAGDRDAEASGGEGNGNVGDDPANASANGRAGGAGGARPAVSIELTDTARLDEPVSPRVTGLRSDERVRLTASTDQPGGSAAWTSSVVLRADRDGVVELADATPIDGSYERADPMGPIWSATPSLGAAQAWFPYGTHDVTFEVRAAEDGTCVVDDGTTGAGDASTATEPLATATTTRRYPDAATEPLGEDLVGTVHLPSGGASSGTTDGTPADASEDEQANAGTSDDDQVNADTSDDVQATDGTSDDDQADGGAAPAVLLLHGSGGQPLDDLAPLLADRGFVVGTLQYFGDAAGIPSDLAEVPLEYVQRAIDRLRERDDVAGDSVGLYGVSKGGELALFSGVHLEGIGAIASVVGSPYVWEGLTADWLPARTSSWSIDGEPVDAIPFPETAAGDAETIRDNYAASLASADPAAIEAATIPVEEVGVPTLLVSGGRDAMWPSVPFGTVVVDRLRREGASFEYEHLSYPGAGHLIRPPHVPTFGRSETQYYGLGGTPAGNATAAAEHWPKLLGLFDRALGE